MISEEAIKQIQQGYKESYPFPHIVIDNFLKPDCLVKVLKEINDLDSRNAYYQVHEKNALEYKKFAFNANLGPMTAAVFKELTSDSFISSVEKLTGIKNIIRNDLTLKGAGVHRIHKDGYLAVHTDFNTYEHTGYGKLDRRINILLYLNADWKEEYKGHLWICNSEKPIKKILPILNRCVIFNTTGSSFHGHPERLAVPVDTMYRQSIACYYYTKNTNDPLDFENRPQHGNAMCWPQFPYDF